MKTMRSYYNLLYYKYSKNFCGDNNTIISIIKLITIAVIAGFAGGIIILKIGSSMADQKLSNTRLNAAIVLCTVLHIAPHIILACLHTPCSGALICWC